MGLPWVPCPLSRARGSHCQDLGEPVLSSGRPRKEQSNRERSRAPEQRAPRHAPGQPRLQQVPARLGGDGRRPWRPARGAAAPHAFCTGRAAAPCGFPLHVPGLARAGAGPGGLQCRSVPVLPSAGEWLPSLSRSLLGKLSLTPGLDSWDLTYSSRESYPLRKGTWGPPASLTSAFSPASAERGTLVLVEDGFEFPPRSSIGRLSLEQVISRFLPTWR